MPDQLLKLAGDKLKKLPGFAFLLPVVTVLYGQAFGKVDAVWGSALTLLICWCVYRLSGRLDTPLYDSLFGPGRRQLPAIARRQSELEALRERVVQRIFEKAGIKTYREAREKNYITEDGPTTLYRRCVALLKPTKLWEQEVKGLLDVSKAARGLVVLLPLLAIILALPDDLFGFSSRMRSGFVTARQNLGPFGVWWIHLLGGAAAVPVFLATRYHHHRRLYTRVAEGVTHVELSRGKFRAEIVDNPLIVYVPGSPEVNPAAERVAILG